MAEICYGVASGSGKNANSPAAGQKRMQIRVIKADGSIGSSSESDTEIKRPRLKHESNSSSLDCERALENCGDYDIEMDDTDKVPMVMEPSGVGPSQQISGTYLLPKFGTSSVCGRRRDMEDAVAVHPSFCRTADDNSSRFHFFAVYDGHGCSHVAMKCKERMHVLLKEELLSEEVESREWKNVMERSFMRMDKEVNIAATGMAPLATCKCELQSPRSDTVGSAAVVAVVTPDQIIVANCGDSRAVLCRNGQPVPLTEDLKPDRPDELDRIEAAGGRVIYWDGPRVLGILAMSRAIGDNSLKPYVSSVPEVTVMDRTKGDECLILASDGLWDVVPNDIACKVARMCLKERGAPSSLTANDQAAFDKPCSNASTRLTKLALSRRSADNISVVVIDLRKPSQL